MPTLRNDRTAPNANPAPVFAALGDATRLQLVSRLFDGRDCSITELSVGLDLTRQGVTKHLRVLEKAGIVVSRRIGRESRYRYVPTPIDDVRNYLETIARQWDDALLRLQEFVET